MRRSGAAEQDRRISARGARIIRAAAAALAFASVSVFAAPAADAHAVFVAASPAPGATLRTPPPAVRITFSEPLDAALSGVRLYTSAGHQVGLGSGRVDTRDPRVYAVRLPPLRPDRYTVVWNSVSAIDGHTRRGSYTFTVDRPDGSHPRIAATAGTGVRAPPQVPTAAQAAARWCGLAGLFLLAGAVLVGIVCGGAGPTAIRGLRRLLRRRLCRLVLAGAGLVVIGAVGELVSDWAPSGWEGSALASLLASSAGRWELIRIAAVAAVVLIRPRARPEPRWVDVASAAGVGVAAFSFAAAAHGAASEVAGLGLAFEFVHVLASSAWLGGAIALAVVWMPLRRRDAPGRQVLLQRYSVVAGVALPLVLATGLGNAVVELGAPDDLVGSSYGVSLLIKLVAVLVLLGVAAVNAVVLRPADAAGRPRGRRLKYTIAIEAALGVAVLVPTAVMGVLAPSRPLDQARAAAQAIRANSDPARAFTGSTRLDGRGAEISITPGAVGANAVRVEIAGSYAASALRLSLTGPGAPVGVELARAGHDHDPATHTIYDGAVRLPRAGIWHAVLRGGGPGSSAPVLLPLPGTAAGSTTPPDTVDLVPWLTLIALGGGAVAVAALARAAPRRRGKVGALVVGGTGLVVALVWAGNLTFAPEDTGQAASTVRWGVARTVQPTQLPDATVWTVPTRGAGLMMPAVAPDGSVWVAEMNADKLARLDPHADLIQEYRFPGRYRETMGVAVDSSGRVWIAQEHAMALGMFDPAAGRYREFPVPGRVPGHASAPVGIAVDEHGDVWFTEMSGNRIGRFDPRTLRFRTYPIPTPDATPYWLAVSASGEIWFTEFAAGKVGVLDPRTGRIREYRVPGGHPNIPGIAVGPDGDVWFTTIQGSLFRLSPSSGRMRRVSLPVAGDYGVTLAADGTVWVGRQGGRTLYAVDPATTAVRPVRLPAGSSPWWPTVDPRGRVWVALAGERGNGLALVHGPS